MKLSIMPGRLKPGFKGSRFIEASVTVLVAHNFQSRLIKKIM